MANQKNNNRNSNQPVSNNNNADASWAGTGGSDDQRTGNRSDERKHDSENTDAEARRDPGQSHDYKGEAQNVNDDTGRALNEDELQHSRNKAQQGRDDEKKDR